jgi:hypothetical protein
VLAPGAGRRAAEQAPQMHGHRHGRTLGLRRAGEQGLRCDGSVTS